MFNVPLKKRKKNKQKKLFRVLMFSVVRSRTDYKGVNTNMVIEIYSYEDGMRCVDQKEYKDYSDWEKDYMIMKFRDTWVGHKIYDMSMKEFSKLSTNTKKQHKLQSSI